MARRISGRAFLVGAGVAAVGIVGEAVSAWVRKEAPPSWAPVATAAVTLIIAGSTAMFEKGGDDKALFTQSPSGAVYRGGAPVTYPGGPPPGYAPPFRPGPAPRRRGIGLAVGLTILLLVFGVGGWAASKYVPKLVVAIRNQGLAPWERPLGDGVERLPKKASESGHGLTVTVTSVKVYAGSKETILTVSVHNTNRSTASISVFEAATLNLDNLPSLIPDMDRTGTTWVSEIGANADYTGTIEFTGAIPGGATKATLVISDVLAANSVTTIQVPLTLSP